VGTSVHEFFFVVFVFFAIFVATDGTDYPERY